MKYCWIDSKFICSERNRFKFKNTYKKETLELEGNTVYGPTRRADSNSNQ